VAQLVPTEIVALSRIMDELDYYQLMHVQRGATVREVRGAYYATSRAFHPDSNRHLEPTLQNAVGQIAKRVTEAYAVLRDPRRRQAYDRMLDEGRGLRIQLAQAQAVGGRQARENEGRTTQGRQYFKLASAAREGGDWGAMARNLQTALTFEPDNEFFKEQLAEAKQNWR
jgi:DnaJ-class molecular chaperone